MSPHIARSADRLDESSIASPTSLRLDARELDHLRPLVDIFGDEPGELVRRIRRHSHGAEISEPLFDARIEHRRVGLLVERRDDLFRRALRHAETDPAGRLVALEEGGSKFHYLSANSAQDDGLGRRPRGERWLTWRCATL